MADNQVSLEILVQIQKSLQDLQTFQDRATKSTQAVADSFGTLKTVGEAALAFLAVDKITSYFSKSIDLAAEQQSTLVRLDQSMANTGQYSQDAADDMKAFADQIQATTEFSNQAILTQLAVAKGFGLSNDSAKQLVKGATELSAAIGISLDQATLQLQKTLSGTLVRLGEQYPALKQFSKEQLEAGAAVKFFSDGLAGTAENLVNTYAGAVAQASNSQADFRRSLGGLFTDNPAVIAAIKGMGDVWKYLDDIVKGNKSELQSWVGLVAQGVATGASVGTEVMVGFVHVFEALALGANDSYQSLLEFSKFLVDTYNEAVSGAEKGMVELVSGLVDFVSQLPGGQDALQGMGVDVDALKASADGLATSLQLPGVSQSLGDAAKTAHQSAVDMSASFAGVDKTLDGLQDAVDKTAQGIFDADASMDASAKLHFQNRSGYTNQATVDLKALEEETKAFAELEKKLNQDQLNQLSPADKAESEWKDSLAKIDTAVHDGVATWQRGEEDKAKATSTYVDKIAKINQEQADQGKELIDGLVLANAQGLDKITLQYDAQLDHIKKLEDEQKISHQAALDAQLELDKNYIEQRNNLLSQHPEEILPDLANGNDISSTDVVSASIGGLNDALQGAAGAANLISQAIGKVADVALPGIGGAVASLVGVLEQGPEATKQFIEQFIDAVPDIVTKIAESMPEIVDGLVDSLINKGGIVKIAVALVESMLLVPEMNQIGKDIGVNFGDSLNSPNFSRTVHGWFSGVEANFGKASAANFAKGIQGAGKELERIPSLISSEIFVKMPGQIRAGFDTALVDLRHEVLAIPGELRGFLTGEVPKAFGAAFGGVRDFFENDLSGDIKNMAGELASGIEGAFVNGANGIKDEVESFFQPIETALASFKFPDIPTPVWLQDFENAVHNLTSFGGIGGGGGSGGGGVLGSLESGASNLNPFHHAAGLDEVPPGFNDDNYLAGLTTGEGVLDNQTNPRVKKMAARYEADQAETRAILGKLAGLLSQPQLAPVELKIGNDTLAKAILKLNRQNARLTA